MKAAGQQIKVLVADDSAVSRKLVEHALSEKHHSLIFAKSGHETLKLFGENHPSLVIVDWIMPDLTGIEICQHIRSKSQAAYTYTIILTGMSDKENVVAGLVVEIDQPGRFARFFFERLAAGRSGRGVRAPGHS